MQAHAAVQPYWEQAAEKATPYWEQAVVLAEPHRKQATEVFTVYRGKFDESIGVTAGEVCFVYVGVRRREEFQDYYFFEDFVIEGREVRFVDGWKIWDFRLRCSVNIYTST